MKKVLFVCLENSCRSQMAEGFARYYGNGILEASSAGTEAGSEVNKTAIAVMKEVGIDISTHKSKVLPGDFSKYDYVVTMGCCSADKLCPVIYSGKKLDWALEDPKGKDINIYRNVRDKINHLVKALIEDIK